MLQIFQYIFAVGDEPPQPFAADDEDVLGLPDGIPGGPAGPPRMDERTAGPVLTAQSGKGPDVGRGDMAAVAFHLEKPPPVALAHPAVDAAVAGVTAVSPYPVSRLPER